VVLVHGFVARASHFRGLQVALHRRQRPTVAVELGWRFRGVDSYAAPVVDTLRLLARSHERVDVVTHSMGGLVLRSALAKHPELAEGLGTVVTLGTPHHGTEAARGLPARLPRDLSDLQPDSPWLQRLPPLHQLAPRAQLHAVGARYDVVAFPLQRVLPDGMVHHVFPGLGHNGLLTAPEVHRLVCALVATTPPPRPAG
jgi:pimeloyl-ACP methyl ester carboxylesterase